MDSIFKISKSGMTGILVEGLELDNSEYLNEETDILISTRNYAYSHTITLNVLTQLSSTGKETLVAHAINSHLNMIDSQEFLVSKDGLYKVTHIIIPTQVWLTYVLDRDAFALEEYHSIFYYGTTTNKFYTYTEGVSIEVTLDDILTSQYIEDTQVTTIIRGDKNTFIMYALNNCFDKICKNILVGLPKSCSTNSPEYKQKIFNRDLLWMGINVIKYSLELSQLYEAQRYLEELTRCSVLCDSSHLTSSYNCGCNN